MKKIISFLELAAFVLGAIGGFGYCAMCKQWLIAIAVVALAVMAFPEVKRAFKDLSEN